MKVMCVSIGEKISSDKEIEYIVKGNVYTVYDQRSGYSTIAERIVDAYEFEEIDGLFECSLFIPLSEFDGNLFTCLKTKPKHKKIVSSF